VTERNGAGERRQISAMMRPDATREGGVPARLGGKPALGGVAPGAARRSTPARAGLNRRTWPLGDLGIADRPGETLDELGRRVAGAEVHGLDKLVEKHGAVVGCAR
jgi:hypothetical protein